MEQAVDGAVEWVAAAVEYKPCDAHEALAALCHALFLQKSFRPSVQSVEESEKEIRTLKDVKFPSDWARGGFGGCYKHARSSLMFDIRAVPMASKLVVLGTFQEDDREVHQLELNVKRYVVDAELRAVMNCVSNYTAVRRRTWRAAFVNTTELASLLFINISERLVPESSKDIRSSTTSAAAGRASSSAREPPPSSEPTRNQNEPRHPRPYPIAPDYDSDPLRVGPPMRPYPPSVGVGSDDLIPSGLPSGLGAPVPLVPGGGVGGNLMGPQHPAFAGRRGGGVVPSSTGPRLPPGAVPPGARFDPFGPPVPGLGEPDNDIEPPGPPPSDMYW